MVTARHGVRSEQIMGYDYNGYGYVRINKAVLG